MLSIHVPTREIICPLKKSWKLRCFSERTMSRNRERSSMLAAAEACGVSVSAIHFNCTTVSCAALCRFWRGLLLGRAMQLRKGIQSPDSIARRSRRRSSRSLRALRGGQQPPAGPKDAPVGPVGFAEEDFAFPRIGVKPAGQERQVFREFGRRGGQAGPMVLFLR